MRKIHNQRDLGAAVRERRHNLGWTQAALAGKLGVTRDWVMDLEAGHGSPQMRYLLRALDVLGLELSIGARDHDVTAKKLESLPHRRIPVVDLDEVLNAHRRSG